MDKLQSLFKMSEPLFREMAMQNIKDIRVYFDDNFADISAGFNSHVKKLYELAKHQQAEGIKNPIDVLYIAYLRSSLKTGSYAYRLSLMGHEFYVDPTETEAYWSMPFMYSTVEQDIKQAVESVKKQDRHMRLTDFDIKELKYHYSQMYAFSSMFFLKDLAANAIKTAKSEEWEAPEMTDSFSVAFGGHMETSYELYPVYRGFAETDGVGDASKANEVLP